MLHKNISIILHLYQPSIQSAAVFKQIFDSSYQPLLKILKNNKNANFTLNMPLSFLELMDSYGYISWISEIGKLYENEKIEITGSAAYHPLLSRVSEKMQEDQIVLNEFGLGFYFGKKTGFEGEKSILLKDVCGFFAPELALNNETLKLISNLGYSWVLVDECSLPLNFLSQEISITKLNDLMVPVRNTQISNKIAFHRGYEISSIVSAIEASPQTNMFLAFDGETFGHHNKDGILFLDSFIDTLSQNNHRFSTVKNNLQEVKPSTIHAIESIVDSSWGASVEQVASKPLPFWQSSENELQKSIWNIIGHILEVYQHLLEPKSETHNLENLPIWKNDVIESFEDEILQKYLVTKLAYSRLVASDFSWWASHIELYNGNLIFDTEIIKKFIELAQTVSRMTNDAKLQELTEKTSSFL